MQKQPSKWFFQKSVMRHFVEFTRKHLMNFAKFQRTLFLQNTIGQLLLIIAVLIVVKGELANQTVNYDTTTKAYVPI